jgi:hypothetical protein
MLPGFETLETVERTTLSGLTLSAGDSPARTFHLLENARGLKENVQPSGQNFIESFAKLDQNGYWLKMYQGYCQVTMDGSLERFSGTWPKAGTMQSGKLYQQAPWAHHIKEGECLLWPTPRASLGMSARLTEYGAKLAWDRKGNLEDVILRYYPQEATGLYINPQFVEAMMGFPQDWTKLDEKD